MKKIILLASLMLPTLCYSQTCINVDSVYVTAKMKQLATRDIRFGIKQTTQEILSEKHCLSDNGDKLEVEVSYVGMPSKSIKFGGVGKETQTTEVTVILHYKGQDVQGEGSSNTDVRTIMIELKDGKVPFSKTTISNSLKEAIQDAVTKLP
jgi:hypothetical protein